MKYSDYAVRLAEATFLSKINQSIETKTHALGGGEWALEVIGSEEGTIFELTGENGTNQVYCPDGQATDLWGELDLLWKDAELYAIEKGYKPIEMVEETPRPPKSIKRGGRNQRRR